MHAMIDIETLGTEPGSVIASIGAVKFDPVQGTLGEEFYEVVSIKDAQLCGLKIDADTVMWWMGQDDQARRSTFTGYRRGLYNALSMLAEFVGSDSRVWGHGACFDLVLLEAAYRAVKMPVSWAYNAHRDTRTLFEPTGVSSKDYQDGTAHNALDDARAQARAVIAAYAKLGLGEVA